MGQNIEVKDVQKTEYLDKNGLDMLWAKVKENTRNQVEVEYNRAKAKEDSLSQEIASVKPAEGKVFLQAEATEDARILEDYVFSFGDYRTGVYAGAAAKGFFVQKDTEEVEISSTGIKADGARQSDTKVWNTKGEITDLANYAKKTDIPEVDTSDFVSKSDTITQTINSGLIAMDKLQVFSKDYYSQTASLRGGIFTEGSDAKLTLNDTTASHNYMELTASKLVMGQDVGSNTLLITTSGIANTDNNANHVYATDGSIADLTQYALSSTLAALEQKVTDNTTAISGKQDAGNYIPFEKRGLNDDRCYIIAPSYYIECRTNKFDNGKYNYSHIDSQYISVNSATGRNTTIGMAGININEGGNASNEYNLQLSPSSISSHSNGSGHLLQFRLSSDGLELEGGRGNKVLTSNGSTIDINQYVLKSIYDEKIAALEARIAALEAKHAETA